MPKNKYINIKSASIKIDLIKGKNIGESNNYYQRIKKKLVIQSIFPRRFPTPTI
jgi:hypothetical protein